ncbi:MAG: hypothetical protein KJO69_06440 [Gammaproteobacteria bacterium]|nr:hypothetical protein [Gammaproteobacteria bacterium]
MAIATDIAIDATGDIYYTGAVHGAAGAGYYTVIELHRYLQDLADDAAASGDDLIDITSLTPSDRSTDNIITVNSGFALDDVKGTDAISEHLYDGSIIQASDGTIWDGLVVIASEGMDLQIIQNGAIVANDFWNTVPNGETAGSHGLNRDAANGISHRFMLKVNNAGTPIDGRRVVGITREPGFTYSEFKINGTARGNNVLALTYTADLNDTTDASARTTIVNNTYGFKELDIDNNSVVEPYYSEWDMAGYTSKQFYERMKWLTACETGDTDATPNTTTLYGLDGNLFRGVTHLISGTQAAGTFGTASSTHNAQPEPISWTGGTGQLLAVDHVTAATEIWMQILTGTAPSSGTVTGGTSGATFTASGNTEFPISNPFCGSSTGSALIGAQGFAIEVADTPASDLFKDLDGTTHQPPNNVTFTVGGIIHTEDRVLVGPNNAGVLRDDQCQVATAEAITVTAGAVSSATSGAGVVVLASNTETIGTGQPSAKDTPTAGTIRVLDANGIYQLVDYTGVTIGTGEIDFTGCTATGTWSAAAANDAFISYIDELAAGSTVTAGSFVTDVEYEILTIGTTDFTLIGASANTIGVRFTATGAGTGTGTADTVVTTAAYTVVYDSDRSLFIRVRDGGTDGDNTGIKTFETTGTLSSAGGSTTAIRTSDA